MKAIAPAWPKACASMCVKVARTMVTICRQFSLKAENAHVHRSSIIQHEVLEQAVYPYVDRLHRSALAVQIPDERTQGIPAARPRNPDSFAGFLLSPE